MADGILVSTQVLRDTSDKVHTINMTLDSKLADINKSVNDLNSTWSSDAGNDIITAINNLKPKFEQYKEVVESYSKFLAQTADEYETTESTVQGNASNFL